MQVVTIFHFPLFSYLTFWIHLRPPRSPFRFTSACSQAFCAHHRKFVGSIYSPTMSLACLVCHNMDSPSRSFRSYSVSSSEDEGSCAAVTCLTRKVAIAAGASNAISTSKVTPFPMMTSGQGTTGAPRLLRSRAVSRDLVRDWNFDQVHVEG